MDSASPEAHEQEEKAAVAGSPGDFLKNIVGKKVKVRIGSGVDYHGEFPLMLITRKSIPDAHGERRGRNESPDWWGNDLEGRRINSLEGFGGSVDVKGESTLISGMLTCLDGYMNVVLEETEEWAGGRMTAKYGDCFLRGNNGEQGLRRRTRIGKLNFSPVYLRARRHMIRNKRQGGILCTTQREGASIVRLGSSTGEGRDEVGRQG